MPFWTPPTYTQMALEVTLTIEADFMQFFFTPISGGYGRGWPLKKKKGGGIWSWVHGEYKSPPAPKQIGMCSPCVMCGAGVGRV